jgi:hypothetical protein
VGDRRPFRAVGLADSALQNCKDDYMQRLNFLLFDLELERDAVAAAVRVMRDG